MAIVEMSKIKLVGLSYHKERLLNTLHKAGCVQIFSTEEIADTVSKSNPKLKEEIAIKYARAKKCVEFLSEHIEKARDKDYFKSADAEGLGNFFVSYDEFISAAGNEFELMYIIDKLEDYDKRLMNSRADRIRINNTIAQIQPYIKVKDKFSSFKATKTTDCFFGTIKSENLAQLKEFIADKELAELFILDNSSLSVISLIAFKEIFVEVGDKLNELGFSACPFDFDSNAEEKIEELKKQLVSLDEYDELITKKTCGRAGYLRNLKILTDYYKLQLEKLSDEENFRCTGKTFILEGYLPKEKENDVLNDLYSVTNAIFIEFSVPDKNDNPPTLVKNRPVVRQTEFITDMYSVPNYRELDPSKVIFFFFMLFMGIIMADIGYGIIMIALGLFLAKRIKVDNGTRRLWYIIAIGGIFTIIFGILFNSFFGVAILPFNVLPSPLPDSEGKMNLETIMLLLVCSFGLGIFQIAVGYFCKALNCFKQRAIADGILDGLIWVLFFVGLVFAAFNFIMDYLGIGIGDGLRSFFDKLALPGLIIVGATVLIAALTAGRNEKGFGKFSKGFGAVYGLINIVSDVLSYARLFGLMLSGMIIAQTFNYKLGLPLIEGGGIGIPLGVIVIIIGHVFNLAMNVLGAYIHDSRLQYIEFFGKFYTGEGEKFTPFGSQFDYIYLTK